MPSRERVQAFVDAVPAGQFVQSIRDFYAEDATAQENLNPARVGREALIAQEQTTLDSTTRRRSCLSRRAERLESDACEDARRGPLAQSVRAEDS